MVKISAFADEVSMNMEEQLLFLSSNGISFIELRFIEGENIVNLNRKEWIAIKNRLDNYRIQVSAIASPIGKSCIKDNFEKEYSRFQKAVELADLFETPLIRVFSYYPPLDQKIEDFKDEVVNRFRMQVSYINGTDIIMVHENEAKIYGHSAINCLELIETIDSPHLRIVYDPANFVWGESILNNVEQCFPRLKDYVIHVHIKDWCMGSKDIGALPGEGDAQIERLIKELKQMNYNGFLTLEPHLNTGGQFGGTTTEGQFQKALFALKNFCRKYEIIEE